MFLKMRATIRVLLEIVAYTASSLLNLIKTEKGYAALFKAGVVLVSASLIAISQASGIIYESDLSAHQKKFQVEAVLKQRLTHERQCVTLATQEIAICRSALYELEQVKAGWRLTVEIFEKSFWLGMLLLVLGVSGFIMALSDPFTRKLERRKRK